MTASIRGGLELPHVTVDCSKVISQLGRDKWLVSFGFSNVDSEDIWRDGGWAVLLESLSKPASIQVSSKGQDSRAERQEDGAYMCTLRMCSASFLSPASLLSSRRSQRRSKRDRRAAGRLMFSPGVRRLSYLTRQRSIDECMVIQSVNSGPGGPRGTFTFHMRGLLLRGSWSSCLGSW